MRKHISIILASMCIIGLVGCGAKNNANTKINDNQSVKQKQVDNTNASKTEEQVNIDLTKENKTILAENEKDIYNGLYDAAKSRSRIVNFDISNYDNVNEYGLDIYINASAIIDNNKSLLVTEHPELNIIEKIESTCNKENKLISVKIYYYYFEDNNDIFMTYNSNEVAAVLNKRIMKNGEKAKIDLIGNNSVKYDIQYVPKDNNIINIDKNGIVDTLKAGETDINVKIISKEDNSKVYSGILKIKVLPEDTVQASNIKELRKVLTEKIGEDSVNIYMKNVDADIIYEGLQSITSPYVFFTTNNDYTFVNIQYYEESKDKALSALKEINKKADEIISKIITPTMTDEKKVETIYDYIINNADYDSEYYSNNKKVNFTSRTAYGILLNGKGICGGFADSINILLRKVGIESHFVSGNGGGEDHAWNVIKLNGEYRYLDVTFDNTYSTKESISHKYFNITEEEISKDHEWNKERVSKFLKAL
jgi:hypothetical protein